MVSLEAAAKDRDVSSSLIGPFPSILVFGFVAAAAMDSICSWIRFVGSANTAPMSSDEEDDGNV
jgi:hypothetical protein